MTNVIVIKCGGSIINELSEEFFSSIRDLKEQGYKIVIVHGGGPEINEMLSALTIKSEFVNGLRKTTKEVLDVVEMILAGKVNKKFVAMFNCRDIKAVGLSGCDGNLLQAKPIDEKLLGFVGEVENVNAELIHHLLDADYMPIISPIGICSKGQKFNINADIAAGSIACALKVKHLLFVTDVPGIMNNGKLLREVSAANVLDLIENGTIYGGMIPKVKAAISSLTGSLEEVKIVTGKKSFILGNGKIHGTKITKQLEVV